MISHHPLEETLAAFSLGKLDEGRALVVSSHLETCSSCQHLIAGIDNMAGARLDALPNEGANPSLKRNMLVKLDLMGAHQVDSHPTTSARHEMDFAPKSLRFYELGHWSWVSRGVYWRPVTLHSKRGARAFLLKAYPGTKLPRHTHTGTELTLVLKGAFSHELGRFAQGDLEDADHDRFHQPIVESNEECVCLVAMEGQLRLLGFMAPLFQPFVRI